MVSMKLWTSWETTYGTGSPQTSSQTTTQTNETTGAVSNEIPEINLAPAESAAPVVQTGETVSGLPNIEIETDIFQLKIDVLGAGITKASLNKFPVDIDKPLEPLVLMESTNETTFISQGGLLSKQPAPTHEARYITSNAVYKMEQNSNELVVPFSWSEGGITITKTYKFSRDSYLVNIVYMIRNNSPDIWSGRSYHQIKRNNPEESRMRFIYTYTGTVISVPEKRYEKITFDDIADEPIAKDTADGWIGVIQHYFLAALIPTDKDSVHHYYTKALGNELYTSGIVTPDLNIAPGEVKEITEQIYIGPKDQNKLKEIAEGLDLTVDYGMLWFLAKPLFWALSEIHKIVNNWGWSIILVTIFLKLIFYKLSAAGYRSMANMRRVQPRLVSLKDRYKDDRVRMNQAMMQIYKEEKINPFGGCFPIVIQIPVFIALYWVLLESVELRQAGFVLWLHDLSTPDPYWVLPLVMGVTMFIQQKLNPAPIDPVQAKIMMTLPVVFTVFFGFFPSGLVLYWVANNTLSILQQWLIMRDLEKAGLGAIKK
jgi:YidC/Oxa1 family membrane protein insertase